MKSRILFTLIFLYINFFLTEFSKAQDQFNFNVTEIEILENGNKIIGSKRGKISTSDGIIIEADRFIYTKRENIINASGKVIIEDKINNKTI